MTVYLVGSGPGDPGLLTMRAYELLQDCDALVYDRLADSRIVAFANKNALKISAGKGPGSVDLTQDETNAKLVELSSSYKKIVRLKGGDPFVFGRGGEEAQILMDNNIDFEIVPGISSSIAGAAYAGIPVTHRGVATNFTVVTGHENPEKESEQVRWKELAAIDGTIVVLMGVGNRAKIAQALIDGGKDPKTPVAIVRNATRPDQISLRCKLDELATVDALNPSVMIIGAVAELNYSWFESKPLFGKSVVVTRAREQNSKLAAQLVDLGAKVIEAPAIAIEHLDFEFPDLNNVGYVVFTSTNGVHHTMTALFESGRDVRYFADVKLCTVGTSTAAALREYGLNADVIPQNFNGDELSNMFDLATEGKKSVVCFRAAAVRDTIEKSLIEKGYDFKNIPVYVNTSSDIDDETLEEIRNADIIAFSSSSTVTNALKLFGEDTVQAVPTKVSIGPITTSSMLDNGLTPNLVADVADIDGVVRAIVDSVK